MTATTDKASSKALTRNEPPYVEMTFKGHEDEVYGVAFVAGTRLLVTTSNDRSLRVWDLDTGKQVEKPLLGHDAKVRKVAVSPDEHWIVSGGENGSILVWEIATNKRELKGVPISFEGHEKKVTSVIFAPDSETFASASWDKISSRHRKTHHHLEYRNGKRVAENTTAGIQSRIHSKWSPSCQWRSERHPNFRCYH
jgi:WD40 repeat protein